MLPALPKLPLADSDEAPPAEGELENCIPLREGVADLRVRPRSGWRTARS